MKNQDIIQRFERVKSERSTVQQVWDLIEEYVCHYRGRFFRDQRSEHSIEWRDRKVWDDTASMAHQTLAANLHGALTSPATQWFTARFRNKALNEDSVAAAWLHDASNEVYWALQDSNFNTEINELYQDVTGFATGFIVEEELDEGEVGFTSVPLKECYFEEDADGGVGMFYRQFQFTPLQILDKFGEDVPEWIKTEYDQGKVDKHDVLFCVHPRGRGPVKMGGKTSPSRRPWVRKYMLLETGEDLGKEGGYYEMPVYAVRFRKTSESVWGNGPAHFALNDILTLNAWVEIATIADEKALDPPMLAEEYALVTDLNLDARSLNIVRNIDGVKPLDIAKSQNITENGIVRLQQNIRAYFYTDQLLFPPPQAQPMTATEAQIRYELMQRLLGPTLGRLQTDLFDRIIGRTFNILARAGRLPEMPSALEGEDVTMDIEYTGPLARAQKAEGVVATQRWLGVVAESAQALGQVSPEAAAEIVDVVDGEQVSRLTGMQLSIDPQMMRSKSDTEKRRNNRQQNMERSLATAQAQQEGEAEQAVAEGVQQRATAQQVQQAAGG